MKVKTSREAIDEMEDTWNSILTKKIITGDNFGTLFHNEVIRASLGGDKIKDIEFFNKLKLALVILSHITTDEGLSIMIKDYPITSILSTLVFMHNVNKANDHDKDFVLPLTLSVLVNICIDIRPREPNSALLYVATLLDIKGDFLNKLNIPAQVVH